MSSKRRPCSKCGTMTYGKECRPCSVETMKRRSRTPEFRMMMSAATKGVPHHGEKSPW